MAIVLDGQLESAPSVRQKIDGGSAVIEGNFNPGSKDVIRYINNPLKVSEAGEKYAFPSRGVLSSSLQACILGAVLVIAFMIVYYKAGGFAAVLSVVPMFSLSLPASLEFFKQPHLSGMAALF